MIEARPPSLDEIRATARQIAGRIVRTPVLDWDGPEIADRLPDGTKVNAKLELFQPLALSRRGGRLR